MAKYLDMTGLTYYTNKLRSEIGSSISAANKFYTTTSTTDNAFEVSIPYITSVNDLATGVTINVKFHTATATGATLNVSGTGAVALYYRSGTAMTTHISAGGYCSLVYEAGSPNKWVLQYAYDSNTNTIGYQLRTNSALYANKTGVAMNRYTLLFEVDGGLSGCATTIGTGVTKTTVSPKYIPGGVIKYYTSNGSIDANSNFTAAGLWDAYTLDLRYTFNVGSSVLTAGKPVYVKMSVNTDGTLSPVYDMQINNTSTTKKHPIVTELPSTADGYVYVYLGRAYSTYNMELDVEHPIYEFKDGKIRLWSGVDLSGYALASSVPTKTSDLTNDSGFLTSHQDISGKLNKLSSTTDNAIVRFDGTSGNIQNSSATVDDNGGIHTSNSIFLQTITGSIGDANNSRLYFGSSTSNYTSYLSSNTSGAFSLGGTNGAFTLYPNTGTYNCMMTNVGSDLGRNDTDGSKAWGNLYTKGKIYKYSGSNSFYEQVLPSKAGTFAMTSDIPSAVTESTVSGWGFTKNTGTVTGSSLTSDKIIVGGGSSSISASSYSVNDIINVAEGKTKTYIIAVSAQTNSDFMSTNSQIDLVSSSTTISLLGGGTITPADLNVGDIILITSTSYPDRWFAGSGIENGSTFYSLETRSVDLTNYVTTNTSQTISGSKTFTATDTIISGNGFSTTNNLLNNSSVYACMRGNNSNPLFGLRVGDSKYYLQATSSGLFLGPTSTVATSWDSSGNITIRGTTQPKWGTKTLATTDQIPTVPTLATVATSGSYNDLSNKPDIGFYDCSSFLKNLVYNVPDDTTITEAQYNILLNHEHIKVVDDTDDPDVFTHYLTKTYQTSDTSDGTIVTGIVFASTRSDLDAFPSSTLYVWATYDPNNNSYTAGTLWEDTPQGTVMSVRVQAGTGLTSSQSTAQTSTLNTTIGIASGYKLPTTSEWNSKQASLVSGTNIKTINGNSILGSGNLTVTATGGWNVNTNSTPTDISMSDTDDAIRVHLYYDDSDDTSRFAITTDDNYDLVNVKYDYSDYPNSVELSLNITDDLNYVTLFGAKIQPYSGVTLGDCLAIDDPTGSYSMQLGESGFTIDDDITGDQNASSILTISSSECSIYGSNILTANNYKDNIKSIFINDLSTINLLNLYTQFINPNPASTSTVIRVGVYIYLNTPYLMTIKKNGNYYDATAQQLDTDTPTFYSGTSLSANLTLANFLSNTYKVTQPTYLSSSGIKTINSQSLVGNGDVSPSVIYDELGFKGTIGTLMSVPQMLFSDPTSMYQTGRYFIVIWLEGATSYKSTMTSPIFNTSDLVLGYSLTFKTYSEAHEYIFRIYYDDDIDHIMLECQSTIDYKSTINRITIWKI